MSHTALEKCSQDAAQSDLAKPVEDPGDATAVLQLTNLHLQFPAELSWPSLPVSSDVQAAYTGLKDPHLPPCPPLHLSTGQALHGCPCSARGLQSLPAPPKVPLLPFQNTSYLSLCSHPPATTPGQLRHKATLPRPFLCKLLVFHLFIHSQDRCSIKA